MSYEQQLRDIGKHEAHLGDSDTRHGCAVCDRNARDRCDKQYCLTSEEYFQLAGSNNGYFVGPGFYYFDEDKDRWRYRSASPIDRQKAMAQHLREHYSGVVFQIVIRFKADGETGTLTYSGKSAGETVVSDLFYCVHDRRDVRELELRSANETKPLYEWRDGEALP